jgi:uncharacterized membrane protein (UPF0127 family)
MKTAERVTIVAIFFLFIVAGLALYISIGDNTELTEVASSTEFSTSTPSLDPVQETVEDDDWRTIYPNTVTINIASTTVLASVADDLAERIQGLSNTPYLPEDVVKLFVFNAYGEHSIWMKDMNYPINILWATREGEIVHVEERVSPDTFPNSFASPTPAWYVVEANAGFVETNQIQLGNRLTLPNQI